MLRFKLRREDYIPSGALKIADKHSTAIAYIYCDKAERPNAVVFVGQQSKPVLFCSYRSEAARANAIRQAFETAQSHAAAVADRRTSRTAANSLDVGDILATCWGYEQTNREFFEVIECCGKHVILREIAQDRCETAHDQGSCRPVPGSFIDGPMRRLVQWGNTVRIDEVREATKWNNDKIDGVAVGPALRWSSYH